MNMIPWLFRNLRKHRGLLRPIRRLLSRNAMLDYWYRSYVEKLRYKDVTDVHDLPPIFHYWANRKTSLSTGTAPQRDLRASGRKTSCRSSSNASRLISFWVFPTLFFRLSIVASAPTSMSITNGIALSSTGFRRAMRTRFCPGASSRRKCWPLSANVNAEKKCTSKT